MLSFFFILCFGSDWALTDIGIFNWLSPNQLAIYEGNIYLLDKEQKEVRKYNSKGELELHISKAGQGPGELSIPASVEIWDDLLHVRDRGRMHYFSLSGEYKKSLVLPVRSGLFFKVADGWLHLKHDVPGEYTQVALTHWDNEFKNPEAFLTFPGQLERRPEARDEEEFVTVIYDNSQLIKVSPSRFYIKLGWHRMVYLFDLQSKSIISEFEIKTPSVAVNKNREKKEYRELLLKHGIKPPEDHFKIPNTYPVINLAYASPLGNLILKIRKGEDSFEWQCYDANGASCKPNPLELHINRVVQTDGTLAYVTAYDENKDEYYLTRLPLKDVDAFIKKHPNPVD